MNVHVRGSICGGGPQGVLGLRVFTGNTQKTAGLQASCRFSAVEKAPWTTFLLTVPHQTWLSHARAALQEPVWAGEMRVSPWIQASFLNVCIHSLYIRRWGPLRSEGSAVPIPGPAHLTEKRQCQGCPGVEGWTRQAPWWQRWVSRINSVAERGEPQLAVGASAEQAASWHLGIWAQLGSRWCQRIEIVAPAGQDLLVPTVESTHKEDCTRPP